MNSVILVALIVVVVLIGAGLFVNNAPEPVSDAPKTVVTANEEPSQSDTTMGMYAEENALVPFDQKPGNSVVVSKALLAEPGYVVVHESADDKPGAIIGTSGYLNAGEHDRVEVMLNRGTRDGETLFVMLHAEKGNDQVFASGEDTPVESMLGGPIMANFVVDVDAELPGDILP